MFLYYVALFLLAQLFLYWRKGTSFLLPQYPNFISSKMPVVNIAPIFTAPLHYSFPVFSSTLCRRPAPFMDTIQSSCWSHYDLEGLYHLFLCSPLMKQKSFEIRFKFPTLLFLTLLEKTNGKQYSYCGKGKMPRNLLILLILVWCLFFFEY